MKKDNAKAKNLEEFREQLEFTSEKDFDGHTCFQDLSVREKLQWLSDLNYFKYIVKNK